MTEERKTVLKRIVWKEYDRYCMYLTREDLLRIGGWLGVQIPDGLSRETIFDRLYESVGCDRFVAALNHEAEERILEREKILAELGGSGEAFKHDIAKLRAFVLTIRGCVNQQGL